MENSELKVALRPEVWVMREEIELEANSKDVLAKLRIRLLPFTHQTIRIFGGDTAARVYYLKTPIIKGNTLRVEAVPFIIIGEIRRPKPVEEVFRFEVFALDEMRTKICGECRQPLKQLEDIFETVWSGVKECRSDVVTG
jgi:hypothetical protein